MGDLIYAIRSSNGFSLKRGVRTPNELVKIELDPKNAFCRCFAFSNGGRYFAYCDSSRTVLAETSTGRECISTELKRTQHIFFSPKDRYMITYEPYVIYGTRKNEDGTVKTPDPNLRFWDVSSGQLLATVVADKQAAWKPYFTENESIALRLLGSEICFYRNGNFEKFTNKMVVKGIAELSVSPGTNPRVACFIPSKNQPSIIQMRALNESLDVLCQKTSFNCDRCVMNWNANGTALLVTASIDVDKSNQSYYGVSHIYYLPTKMGADPFKVTLNKEGPVHYLEWAPNSSMFCICYGFMPSKTTIFNKRGDVLWDIGEGHRNELHFNPQSTILVTCGFGNIASGKMEFWNLETRKEISQFSVPHTTHFQWAPDGRHICTSTTAPRLRTDNGYRIWNYQGEHVYEYLCQKEELWEVKWRPSDAYNKFPIEEPNAERKMANAKAVAANNNVNPVNLLRKDGVITSQNRYVPPAMRSKKNNVIGLSGGSAGTTTTSNNKTTKAQCVSFKPEESEMDKRIRTVKKKLEEIGKLREREKSGQKLELNQVEKMKGEDKLRQELEQLQLEMAATKA